MKKFKWEIDEDENLHGVKAISLVDQPAMESDFIAFSKEKVHVKYIKLESEDKEYKQIVAGLAMIPDKEILRVDPETNEEYVGYFDAETIEQIRTKFHKEQQDQNVNIDHVEDEEVDAFLIESYILNSEKQVEDLVDKGIEEASIGSWYVAYKIEDKEVFDKVLEGEYNGFSVELYANRILESFKYNNNYKKTKFSMENILEKLKTLIQEYATEETTEDEVKFISVTIPELGIEISQEGEDWVVDGDIVSVTVDDAGEETREALPDGEYTLEDGRIFVVADGKLTEIKDAPAEDETEEELKDDEVKAEIVDDEVKSEEEDTDGEGKDTKKTLEELIDMSKDGWYTVEVGVEGGEFTYGAIYANTWKELDFKAENFKAREDEIVTLKAEVEALKLKIKEPISDPKLGLENNVVEEIDTTKLSNFERIALRNKLPIV